MAQQLPDLSRLPLGDDESVDTGAVAQSSGIRKPTSRRQRREELARLVADDPYEDDGEDEDWPVPDDLRGLDRSDASRGRIAPRRRAPSVAKDVRNKTGAAGTLFYVVQQFAREMWKEVRKWYWCEDKIPDIAPEQQMERQRFANDHAVVARRIIDKYAFDDASWTRQGYATMPGQIHDTIVPESTFRAFFDAYIALRGGLHVLSDYSKTPEGYFTQVEWEMDNKVQVAKALAVHAQLLSPLLDAFRKFGFAPKDKVQFQVLWRFLPVRHNNSYAWHMDENDFMLYGDDSMAHAERWTSTGTRSVVTVSCLNVDPSQPTMHCGTRILSGVPTFTEKAVKGVVDDLWAAKDLLHRYNCNHTKKSFAVWFNRLIRRQTENALAYYTWARDPHDYTRTIEDRAQQERRAEKKLESAGVRVVRMANGEIGTFNDHAFHSSSTTPPNHVRMLLVLRGANLDNNFRVMPFRKDAEIFDRDGRRAELSFQPL